MVNLRRTMAILGATALTLAIAVTAVVADGPLRALAAPASTGATVGTPSSAGVSTEAFDLSLTNTDPATFTFQFGPGQPGDLQATCQDFMNNLASNLKVAPDQLQAAIKQTLLQQVDAALAAGKLTSDQAQAARDRINNSTPGFCMGVGAGIGPVVVPGVPCRQASSMAIS
jgi:hypothetical protein